MPRSTSIFLFTSYFTWESIAAFTVKHEAVRWYKENKKNFGRLIVYRFVDGGQKYNKDGPPYMVYAEPIDVTEEFNRLTL